MSNFSLQDTINGIMESYVKVEDAKAGQGLAATVPDQQAGMGQVPQSANPQARTGGVSVASAVPPWAWPLIIAGGVVGGVLLLSRGA